MREEPRETFTRNTEKPHLCPRAEDVFGEAPSTGAGPPDKCTSDGAHTAGLIGMRRVRAFRVR